MTIQKKIEPGIGEVIEFWWCPVCRKQGPTTRIRPTGEWGEDSWKDIENDTEVDEFFEEHRDCAFEDE